MTDAPIIETERLRLRAHRAADFPVLLGIVRSDHGRFLHAPDSDDGVWYGVTAEAGAWGIYGWGGWAIERRADGVCIGQVALTQPPRFPELELGWMLTAEAQGQGLAFEAASAARDHAFGPMGRDTVVSYITPANSRSVALAERLGARHDPQAALPRGETTQETAVYRHGARS
ncbi:GNAT family N-acetyltransferase [Jannaschia rubra]|uniref:Acetyltransferase (GNAT) family protein n=1 Tax=Jannaschia rubra TaxID=282197 RepID=A0A0M6XT65_9RHOB|nr:GNAT family N-acetyltransferase [Jannaschia rubra]CTQ33433.1 Acetyltransferase (GNAT) family protein [Jannaschia rubra]SFG01723.1 Protein N-acetyltransferase, RimJ/RimL family [Jannaschia rubra]